MIIESIGDGRKMDMYSYDQDFEHDGIKYVILEITQDDYCIVAKKEDVEQKKFPVPVFMVPRK